MISNRRRSRGMRAVLLAAIGSGSIAALVQACGDDLQPPPGGIPKYDAGNNLLDGGGDASTDSSSTDSSTTSDADADAPLLPSLCSPTATWKAAVAVNGLGLPESELLGAVTADELTVAWTTPTAGGGGTVRWADRATTADPFGAAQTLASSLGAFALDGVALSADGMTLVVVKADRSNFVAISRTARSGAFDTVVVDAFKSFNLGEGMLPPSHFSPVLSPDGTRFVYAIRTPGLDQPVILESQRNRNGGWQVGSAYSNSEFFSLSGQLRRPTGIASDGRTLFYYDEVSGTEKAAWRDSVSKLTYTTIVDLGAKQQATPNAACTRLYFVVPSADGGTTGDGGALLGIVSADKN